MAIDDIQLQPSSTTIPAQLNPSLPENDPFESNTLVDFDIESLAMPGFNINNPGTARVTMLNSLPFPFQYAFEYVLKGMRHSPHNFSDSFQLHIIQDFEFDEAQKEILYKSKGIAVAILLVEFVNGLLIVSVCNGCSSYRNLQMFLPVKSCKNVELPSFSADRFCGCRHTASVVSKLCDHHNIPSGYDLLLKHSALVKHLKTAGNPVLPGWQNLGTRLLTFRKHLFGCYLTPEYHLLCFNVSKKMIY